MKEYTISKVDKKPIDWEQIPKAEIDNYKWADNEYTPKVYARICYDDAAMYIKFWAFEDEVCAVHLKHGGDVWKDSCVEFFFRPNSSPLYMNIETNVLGYMLIGIGEGRNGRERIAPNAETMQVEASVQDIKEYDGKGWTVSYQIPFSLLKQYYGDIDFVKDGLRANLYKCGDETKYEHYGMWNPIVQVDPDFHAPGSFGQMQFA